MKTLKYLGFIFTAMIIFIACSKELSLETGFSGGNATGTLGSISGQCDTTTQIHGEYVRDSIVNDSNYLLVRVNFASPGLYKIITETENGFSFYDSGYMINTGLQNIKLKAVGRPITKGNTSFLITFNTDFCSITVPVVDTPTKQAIYTLNNFVCDSLKFVDSFRVGLPLDPNNTFINVPVKVTKKGNYSINTNTVNGMRYSVSGTFTGTGITTIKAKGNGTPIRAEKDTLYLFINGDTACRYTIVVLPSVVIPPPTAADSAWQFNQGTPFYYGSIDSAKIDSLPFVTLSGIVKVPGVGIWGSSYATGDSSFFIGVPLTGGTVVAGTYNSNSLTNPTAFDFYKTPTTTNIIYSASFADVGVNLVTTVISYDTATKIIKGTFTGTARNATLTSVPVTNGKFTAKVR